LDIINDFLTNQHLLPFSAASAGSK